MKNRILEKTVLLALMTLLLWGCRDPWEEHVQLGEGVPDKSLFEIISSLPELSEFAGCLVEAGWQQELESSKSYTVWAPDNNAMGQLDPGVLEDPDGLAIFVDNHITLTAYSCYSPFSQLSIKTCSGKNLIIDNENGMIGDAKLLEPCDRIATNGILHIIDKALVPRPNTWDFVESTDLAPLHVEYLNSLTGMVFDPSVATITGVDPVSGRPVYDTLSGMVWDNRVITEIRDLRDEDSLSTLILVDDPVWNSEFGKYRKYYLLEDSVESDDLTKWMISRDLVFRGKILSEEAPDTLVSLFGIKIPFDREAIQYSYEASNGIIYVMNSCDVSLQEKIPPVIVEGEDTTMVIFTSVSGQTGYTRQVEMASGGYDFILDNHGASPGNIKYHMGDFVAGYYKFYWVAVNDFDGSYRNPDPDMVLQQQLAFVRFLGMAGQEMLWSPPSIISDLIEVVDSTYETAQEVYLGQRFFTTYQDVWLQVTGSGRNTTICLDYLKAVPVLE